MGPETEPATESGTQSATEAATQAATQTAAEDGIEIIGAPTGAKVWFITGCSTGIGREIAVAALEAGDRVALTARKPETVTGLVDQFGEQAIALPLDVTNHAAITEALAATEAQLGPVDVLVNNAGYGYMAAVEEGDDAEVRKLFDTNFFAAVDLIKAVLPSMRERRTGHIINISSMTGLVSNPPNVYYSCTKFALESLTEGLAKEVEPFGVRVSAIEPGAFRTDWASRSMGETDTPIGDYDEHVGTRRELIRAFADALPGDPRKVGDAAVMLSRHPNPPLRLLLGKDVLAATREKLAAMEASIAEWEAVTVDVDFPPGS